jgi:hypothetical protein
MIVRLYCGLILIGEEEMLSRGSLGKKLR